MTVIRQAKTCWLAYPRALTTTSFQSPEYRESISVRCIGLKIVGEVQSTSGLVEGFGNLSFCLTCYPENHVGAGQSLLVGILKSDV